MLKKVILFSFVLFCMSCGDDSDRTVLNYDGDNIDAPALFPGDYTAMVRFPSTEMSQYSGRQIEEIEFWVADIPVSCELQILGEGTANTPGSLILSDNVTLSIDANSWNSINLNSPVDITGEDLWVGFNFEIDAFSRVIGCDAGPAVENGDLLNDENGNWTTLRAYSADEVDINWNIRAYLSE